MAHFVPVFTWYIAGVSGEITRASPLWSASLCKKNSSLLIHEFFEAAESFLTTVLFHPWAGEHPSRVTTELPPALPQTFLDRDFLEPLFNNNDPLDRKFSWRDVIPLKNRFTPVSRTSIFLEKHGAFYHPARVEIILEDSSVHNLVLNCAVSPHGLALIEKEYLLLRELGRKKHLTRLIPRVFATASFHCRGMETAFFLGEWFDGYKEFHLSGPNPSHPYQTLHMWNSDGTMEIYDPPEFYPIYERASEILTDFYNIETFEQIFPWHHAAGDFIVKPLRCHGKLLQPPGEHLPLGEQLQPSGKEPQHYQKVIQEEPAYMGNGFDVKLITVRGYDSMFISCDDDDAGTPDQNREEHLHNDINDDINDDTNNDINDDINKALLIFFLNLSLRMRIDRIDGTGDYTLLHHDALDFIIKGFFISLDKKDSPASMKLEKRGMGSLFLSYLQQFHRQSILMILDMITDGGNPHNPEFSFIKQHIESHAEVLSQKIRSLGKNCFFIDNAV
ncbi:MAG: hypothetical protein HQK66_02050 [Desulfamplus sp.]|nr:hypothetical protein [Desulfamplus sp.]